ncbi:1,5-anhydro-D-fructose reductase [Stieleria maiorica]|uniref:1,5-anhydro-D-fructose reductase n=1 Tax=Stieleria maiorica TaxID=2795974 RepID=A0A5B9MH70_9BACT|nr:Gfo/Idh/MocA family oxidoreductase [Stieleria maiorica]QEF98427.1 1,5-anhydro-D-fructose reductase [Stieleria maiorica]
MLRRRQFLAASAAGIAAAPAFVRGQNLNSRVQIAGIGCDGKGWSDIKEMDSHAATQMVAYCDVDLSRTEKVKDLTPGAPVYQDFREMLARHGDSIDAVTVSTPDHMHAFIGLDAMRQGKHVYCQKPLTHNVWEARQMALQAKQSGVITRLGNQIHSHTFYRTAVAAIQSGVIGKVKEVHSWCAATGHGKSFHISRPKTLEDVPKTLAWNQWLGVAPERPYGGWKIYHPWGWRDWQDFGNGALGDFGCHILDPVFTALKINAAPIELTADHTGLNDEVWPAQTTVKYVFPGTDWTARPALPITWYDGGRLPTLRGTDFPSNQALPKSGSLFVGEQASLVLPHVGAPFVSSGALLDEVEGLNHYHGWVDGIISGQQPSDGFDYGGPLTEAVLLGNVAVRYRGETLKWNGKAMQFTNDDSANAWLRRDYRDGWDIAAV